MQECQNIQIRNRTRYNHEKFSFVSIPDQNDPMLPKPNISLDEFLNDPTLDDILEPPRQVLLRSTGEIEVLKPLAYWEGPKTERLYIAAPPQPVPARSGFTWLHGSMIAGGALVLLGVAIIGAVVLTNSFSSPQQAVTSEPLVEVPGEAPQEAKTEIAVPASEPPSQEVHASNPPVRSDEPEVDETLVATDRTTTPQSDARSKRPAPVTSSAKTVTRTTSQPRPQPADRTASTFTPSKTVIYVENGQIKKRVEPQSNSNREK